MRLPDFSPGLPRPGDDLDPVARGRLLLGYVSGRQSVRGLDFSRAVLRSADLRGADLSGAVLVDANLYGADLRGACLAGADLERASLEQANAGEADLRNARLLGAQLGSVRLGGADLRFADLQRARLQYAVLMGARLEHADLRGANLQRARLRQARLGGADLRGADLRFADLLLAEVAGAHVDRRGAQLSAWAGPALEELLGRGLVLSEQAPPPPQAAEVEAREGTEETPEGLWLRLGRPLSPLEVALLGVAVAAWRTRAPTHTAVLVGDPVAPRVTAEEPAELEALALLLCAHRWEELDLAASLTPGALAQLEALVAAREGFELWLRKSDGVRKVLSW